MVPGAVYVTEQRVNAVELRVQVVVPREPCPPLEPVAVFETA
jgi:hypothetical protein